MPHLVQMDKRYGDKGLQLIGVERQNSSTEAIAEVVKEYKIKFPIAKGGGGPVDGGGIPHMFVFDVTGQLIFSGHPNDAEKIIKKELRKIDKGDAGEKNSGFGLPPRKEAMTELRDWTNTEGKTIRAELVSADLEAGTVTFKLANRKLYPGYPIANLSEDDQKLVKEKAAEADE